MIRSLWSGATGMNAQQIAVDTIAHNLSNVNTTGYKAQSSQFKTLLYQNLQTKTTSANGAQKPVTSQIGLGVRNSSINSLFTQGSFVNADSTTAFAIQGDGFFAVRDESGGIQYTRNGDFTWAIGGNNQITLTTTDGLPVLDTTGRAISLPANTMTNRISIDSDGTLLYADGNNNPVSLGIGIGLYQFRNPGGLERMGDSQFRVTPASGAAINEAVAADVKRSKMVQGYLEGSNVKVADEMVNLIVAQRAYEMNSKSITTSDEMMQQANNLKR